MVSSRASSATPTPSISNPSPLLRSPSEINLVAFNAIHGPDDRGGRPILDMARLFHKQVIVDDETILNVETLKVPGFIGIADELEVIDTSGNRVSGHEDIVKFLKQDGLLICTYQYHKDRYGTPIDLRWDWSPHDTELFLETFIKNEGHHAGAIVPARRLDQNNEQLIDSYATLNEPDDYHQGMFGSQGFIAIAQRLIFADEITSAEATAYKNSIINWMALLNPFVQFSDNDFNGSDPTSVIDPVTLRELLKNVALASLKDEAAIKFLNDPVNGLYCAEFIYICLNTPLYPFNKKTLTELLGDETKASTILTMRDRQNKRQVNYLSEQTNNPEFKNLNIPMPVVLEDLLPLDVRLNQIGSIASNTLPFPPFKLSDVIRRAFHTLLPRRQLNTPKLIGAQARLFSLIQPMLLYQIGLDPSSLATSSDPTATAVREFMTTVQQQLARHIESEQAFDECVDALMQQAEQLLNQIGNSIYFVPPRIYVDLGQNDGDRHLPQGWGFRLETIGALVFRGVIQ